MDFKAKNKPIIFYDGKCALCHSSVVLLIRWGGEKHYYFASLQGKTAKLLLSSQKIDDLNSIVLMTVEGEVFSRSSAIIRILAGLGGIGTLSQILFLIPKPVRDFFYDQVAAHRYRFFGEASCDLSKDDSDAFLD